MSNMKVKLILIVISVGMLTIGAAPTSAFVSTGATSQLEIEKDLDGQEIIEETVPLNSPIGNTITIHNEVGLVEEEAAVAYSSERQQYLVVWYNDRPGNDDISAQRVSKNGEPLPQAKNNNMVNLMSLCNKHHEEIHNRFHKR